jgi:prophage maintenance system killer protein
MKAAVLGYRLAKSQACLDGNKRVALLLLTAFLGANGWYFATDDGQPADQLTLAAESEPSDADRVIADLASWIGSVIQRLGRGYGGT